MNLNRQHILMGVLAAVAIWALWYFLSSDQVLTGGATGPSSALTGAGVLPPMIEIASLESRTEEFDPSGGRNLFAYAEARVQAVVPPPPPKNQRKREPVTKTPEQIAAEKRPPPPPPKEIAPPGPEPPAVTFKFVGYLGPPAGLIGVFRVTTPDGEEVVLAAEGEVLAEDFRVHRIGYEEVEIGYTQEPFLNEKKILPMGGQS